MKTVDEIYQSIADNINNSIDQQNWAKAKLDIEITGVGVVGYSGAYEVNNICHDISVRKISRDVRTWVRELHSITTEGGNNRWNRATFTLEPNGKFDMKFVWDQALQDEVERLSKT